MAYKLTPADRRARAELIRAQRDARFTAQRRDAELKRIEGESSPSEESEKNSFLRALITAGDVGGNVLSGLAKGLEGIHDFEQSLVPSGLGLILGGSPISFAQFIWAKKNPEKHRELIEKDFAGTYVSDPLQRATKDSYTNNSKAGEVVEGVASGIGQMLPAVAVTALSGGTGAPAAATQALSLGTTAASASGNATEQAFRDGAGYAEGVLYGVASGAVEAGTEKLMGGLGGLYGKGIKGAAKAGVKSVAKTGVKRIAAEAAGEAVEEALAEVVNPTLKTIYKGKDALAEYGEAEFWGGVGEAALIGGLTSPAYGATVGRALKTSGTYADARSVMEHIDTQESRIADGDLSVEQEVQARKNIKADYEVLSRRLMHTSENTRANVLKNPQLAAAFDADGTLKADFVAQLDGRIRAAGDTSSGLDRRYYSTSARGREAEIIEGLAAQGTKVYEGELSAEEDVAYQKAKQIHSKLRSMGFVETDLVLSETMPDANAYLDGNTVVIGKDSLADGSYIKHLVHETTHFTEGTQEWVDVMEHVFGKDAKGVSALMQRVMESGYGVTQADVDAVAQAVLDGNLKDAKLTKAQQTLVSEVVAMQMEETFGNEAAIKRLVGEKPNLAKQILSRIKAFLQTFGKKSSKDPEAIQNLRRTEELFRKALSNAGVSYAVDELTRANAEKMHDSGENGAESVDEAASSEHKKSPAEGESVKYSRSVGETEKAAAAFSKGTISVALWDAFDHKDSGDDNLIRVSKMPRYVTEKFGIEGDFYIYRDHAYENMVSKEDAHSAGRPVKRKGRDIHFHNLGIEKMTDALLSIEHPVMTIDDTRKEGNPQVVMMLDVQGNNNAPLYAVLSFYSDQPINGRFERKPHIVLTVAEKTFLESDGYGSWEETVRRAIEDGRVLDFDKNKRTGLSVIAQRTRLGNITEGSLAESISQFRKKINAFKQKNKISYSRKTTSGGVVTISEGEMAKLHANYAGDKVFDKKSVSEALASIDAFKKLSPEIRRDFVDRIWKGYNQRLHQQGFEQFTEMMWEKLHATIMQEVAYDELGNMTEEQYAEAERVMDEQIVAALRQIVASGKPSIKAKLESATSTEGYRNQARFWRDEHARVVARNKLLGRVKFEVEKLANLKAGRYVNAANYKNNIFSKAITELARMNWRGGMVRDAKIREHFAALAAWYSKDNPLYKTSEGGNELFRQDIKDALEMLGNAQNGALTNDDLLAAESVIKYFAHEIEAHNTVYRDGKRVDAMPEAKRYVENVARAKEIAVKCGIWQRLTHSGFARLVADPAMLMRQADGYLDGFFTDQYEQLRQGTIDAAVMERELAEEFEKFWDDHKAYGRRYNNATVTFDGKEMPLQEAISLYMTMKREQAWAGLAGAGFEIEGKDATESVSEGFAEFVEKHRTEEYKKLSAEDILTLTKEGHARIDQIALEKAIEEKREALFAQFTDEDKALISLMEKTLEDCRDVKVKIDEIVQGYSNVTGGYYFPIRRTGLAENVDAWTGFEGDRVSNLSINKDTVKNAHKLLIEPAHIVFMRHLKAVSLYHGLGVFTDNFNRLFNLNITENANNPTTVRTALGRSNKFAKEMLTYFKELKQDVEGISKKRSQEKAYNDVVAYIRSAYATYQLGANPKVWVTQLSSLVAATNMLDVDCLARGVRVSGKDVDEFCRLAWLRNNDNAAAMAQAVSTPQNAVQRAGRGVLRIVRDAAMAPIGKVDRLVICRLFAACQVQVQKKGGAKIGTRENKVEAGKLLQRVILETQQNSLATERSAAMRSGDELLKGFTMFSADAMKVGARFVDAFGELSALKTLRKEAKKAGNSAETERLDKKISRARKQCGRATASLVGVAIFNALIAYGFKWLYRRDDEENAGTFIADTFGNMLGGIPFIRDFWSFFQDGFEMDHFLISTVNDVLGTAAASFELVKDAAGGKEITRQQALGNMRKVLYAAGQLSGIPVRNVYNVATGMLNRVSPKAGYSAEALFVAKPFTSDLKKAIEADDEEMIGTIAGLMVEEKGVENAELQGMFRELVGKGYSVLPRSVGDKVSMNGTEIALSGKQQKRFRELYRIGDEAVTDMVKLRQFSSADEKVRAKAVQFIYDVYWELALESVTGEELAERNVLFAEAIPIEKLAIIIATARAIEADKDKDGKAISGTKKRKVQTFVNSLHLTAAQKYMVMGYLGYSNINGEDVVKGYINKLNLSKGEKAALLKYSGYAE